MILVPFAPSRLCVKKCLTQRRKHTKRTKLKRLLTKPELTGLLLWVTLRSPQLTPTVILVPFASSRLCVKKCLTQRRKDTKRTKLRRLLTKPELTGLLLWVTLRSPQLTPTVILVPFPPSRLCVKKNVSRKDAKAPREWHRPYCADFLPESQAPLVAAGNPSRYSPPK